MINIYSLNGGALHHHWVGYFERRIAHGRELFVRILFYTSRLLYDCYLLLVLSGVDAGRCTDGGRRLYRCIDIGKFPRSVAMVCSNKGQTYFVTSFPRGIRIHSIRSE